jgi:hypothetical protein
MSSLVAKVGSVVPIEPGERLLAAAYVPAIGRWGPGASGGKILRRRPAAEPMKPGETMGPSVVAVSDRRFLFAPRSAFLSASAWRVRRLEDVRVEISKRRSMGFGVARRFEVLDAHGTPVMFELEQKKDAEAFRRAFAKRLVHHGAGR